MHLVAKNRGFFRIFLPGGAWISQADGFYPYHAAWADLLRRTNQRMAAAGACQRALDLCGNRAERAYLQRRLDKMLNPLA